MVRGPILSRTPTASAYGSFRAFGLPWRWRTSENTIRLNRSSTRIISFVYSQPSLSSTSLTQSHRNQTAWPLTTLAISSRVRTASSENFGSFICYLTTDSTSSSSCPPQLRQRSPCRPHGMRRRQLLHLHTPTDELLAGSSSIAGDSGLGLSMPLGSRKAGSVSSWSDIDAGLVGRISCTCFCSSSTQRHAVLSV